MKIAHVVAERSTCDRANVGCVLVRDKQMLVSGFNGAPSGLSHCSDIGHLMIDDHCHRSIHAEVNAIIQAAQHGISIIGAHAYLTHSPCLDCSNVIINAGIIRVVYAEPYRVDELAMIFFRQARVLVEQLDNHNEI